MITELSLLSGGEYEIFLLLQIHDTSLPLLADEETVEALKKLWVPRELRNITVLWNEAILSTRYSKVGDYK